MSKYTTIRLKPNEYKTADSLIPVGTGSWIPSNGLLITKDDMNLAITTPTTVDSDCEIEVRYNEQHRGFVKYITSSPRRKYYIFIKWLVLALQLLSIILMVIEVCVFKHYAVRGSRSYNLIAPCFSILCLDIVILRNNNGFTKWAVTIFSYFLLIFNLIYLILYFFNITI